MPQNDLSKDRSRLQKNRLTPGSQRVTDDADHDIDLI
jgi:hypothetical protein